MPRRTVLAAVPDSLMKLAAAQNWLLTTAQLEVGGIDANDLRSLAKQGGWTRPVRGVWAVPTGEPPDAALAPRRLARAAMLAVGGGVACLGTAAAVMGLDGAPLDKRVHISIAPRETRGQCGGVALHWLVLDPSDVILVDGIPCTAYPRLLLDAARRWDRDHVVSLLDSALHHGRIGGDELTDLAARFPASRRAWLMLGDGRSESPLETRVRLLLIDHGLVPEDLQTELFDALARLVARLDITWPSLRVGVECDGAGPHGQPLALYRDRMRQDDVNDQGWRIVRVTWDDWLRRPADVVRRVRRALDAARRSQASPFVR